MNNSLIMNLLTPKESLEQVVITLTTLHKNTAGSDNLSYDQVYKMVRDRQIIKTISQTIDELEKIKERADKVKNDITNIQPTLNLRDRVESIQVQALIDFIINGEVK